MPHPTSLNRHPLHTTHHGRITHDEACLLLSTSHWGHCNTPAPTTSLLGATAPTKLHANTWPLHNAAHATPQRPYLVCEALAQPRHLIQPHVHTSVHGRDLRLGLQQARCDDLAHLRVGHILVAATRAPRAGRRRWRRRLRGCCHCRRLLRDRRLLCGRRLLRRRSRGGRSSRRGRRRGRLDAGLDRCHDIALCHNAIRASGRDLRQRQPRLLQHHPHRRADAVIGGAGRRHGRRCRLGGRRRRRRSSRLSIGRATTALLEILEGSHMFLLLHDDSHQRANSHILTPSRHDDLCDKAVLLVFKCERRLVGLDLGEHVARLDLVPLRNRPTDNVATLHGGRQRRHVKSLRGTHAHPHTTVTVTVTLKAFPDALAFKLLARNPYLLQRTPLSRPTHMVMRGERSSRRTLRSYGTRGTTGVDILYDRVRGGDDVRLEREQG
eukprot:366450-Chlamydomonas_euryale.AAC.36